MKGNRHVVEKTKQMKNFPSRRTAKRCRSAPLSRSPVPGPWFNLRCCLAPRSHAAMFFLHSRRQQGAFREKTTTMAAMDSAMSRMLRIAMWISGAFWLLSSFVIYLEIFHWHHMTTSFRLNPPPPIPGFPPPRPGGFLISAIVLSIASPPIFISLLILKLVRTPKNHSSPLSR